MSRRVHVGSGKGRRWARDLRRGSRTRRSVVYPPCPVPSCRTLQTPGQAVPLGVTTGVADVSRDQDCWYLLRPRVHHSLVYRRRGGTPRPSPSRVGSRSPPGHWSRCPYGLRMIQSQTRVVGSWAVDGLFPCPHRPGVTLRK